MEDQNFFQKYSRLVSILIVLILSAFFPGTDFETEGVGFFESVFSNLTLPIGAGLMLLLQWVGDRQLFSFKMTTTFQTVVAILITGATFALGDLAPPFVEFLSNLQATGMIATGSVVGILISLFGNKNVPFELDTVQ